MMGSGSIRSAWTRLAVDHERARDPHRGPEVGDLDRASQDPFDVNPAVLGVVRNPLNT